MHRSAKLVSHHYTSTRNFSYTTTLQPNYVLDQLSVLSTRGHLHEALSFFYTAPIHFQSHQAYAILFHECSRQKDITQGLNLHRHLLSRKTNAPPPDVFLTNHVINMYAKCGHLESARNLFDEMPEKNLVSWTALLSGYAQRGCQDDCFNLFSGMLAAHFRPNEFAFTSLLSKCDYLHGKLVHGLALKMGLDASVYVKNGLIVMYGKSSGCIDEAWSLFESMEFRNLVSWNSMITCFQSLKFGIHGVNLFTLMHRDGIMFDRATLLSVISSLCGIDDVVLSLKLCLQLHCLVTKTGFTSEIEVMSALVKAYSVLGENVDICYMLFMETTCCKDIVSWTGIITAFVEHDPIKALFLFKQLRREHVITPDRYTYSIVLKACASLVNSRHTLVIHSQVMKSGFVDDLVLNNALIHGYSRSGSIALSKQVFDEMGFRDLVTWNSMLKGYALHGKGKDALTLFSRMDIEPDSATYVAVLSACSHCGLVEEGSKVFESMLTVRQLEHYACMVDILGRAGRVDEAELVINKMPMEPDSVIWSSLLGSCRKHGVTRLAKLAAEKMKELEPNKSLSYVQMANVFSSGGGYIEAGLSRKEMKGLSVRKQPGLSWVEIGNRVHEFGSGGWRHPQRDVICLKLEQLMVKLKEMGYVPATCLALCDIEEEHKEEQLLYHSEKLALACFVLVCESDSVWFGSCIQIMKNIRICVDCHNFMKLASDLVGKEIVVRDSNRFHHFKNRVCSCNDYW